MRGTPAALALLGLFSVLAPACGATSIGPQKVIDVGVNDAGRTVQLRVGDVVRVTLEDQFPVPGSSLVWSVASSAPSVVGLQSTSVPSPRPGSGSSTYVAEFLALSAGQARLDARGATTCEAMAKQSCPDRAFMIAVIVSS